MDWLRDARSRADSAWKQAPEGTTDEKLASAVLSLVKYLEEQASRESQGSSPTTASPTTEALSVAQDGHTQAPTPASSHPLGGLTEAELIHVVQCFECMGLLEKSLGLSKTLAQDVAGTILTLAKVASSPSVADSEPVESRSPELNEQCLERHSHCGLCLCRLGKNHEGAHGYWSHDPKPSEVRNQQL